MQDSIDRRALTERIFQLKQAVYFGDAAQAAYEQNDNAAEATHSDAAMAAWTGYLALTVLATGKLCTDHYDWYECGDYPRFDYTRPTAVEDVSTAALRDYETARIALRARWELERLGATAAA